jgi:hypothetical protein
VDAALLVGEVTAVGFTEVGLTRPGYDELVAWLVRVGTEALAGHRLAVAVFAAPVGAPVGAVRAPLAFRVNMNTADFVRGKVSHVGGADAAFGGVVPCGQAAWFTVSGK